MTYDAAAFGALALALSVLGGIVTWFRWRKHGLPALLRGTAWSLLPAAAWLTGVLRLLVEIGGEVGHWAVRLVFSPTVWVGLALAGVSVVLFVVSGFLPGRRVAAGPGHKEVRAPAAGGEGLDGMDDIDAILRKHGIQ